MKRLLTAAFLAVTAFVGLTIAGNFSGHDLTLAPAPASTLAPPSPSPTPFPAQSSSATLSGVGFGFPQMAWDLNAANASVALINITNAPANCSISVSGTYVASLAVTTASTIAGLQSQSNIVGWITGTGVYSIPLGSNSMLQVETLAYTSGDPIVAPACGGGTVLLPGLLP